MKKIIPLIIFLLGLAPNFAQQLKLMEISRWRNGPCLAVAQKQNLLGIFVGNGAKIEVLETPFMTPLPQRVVTRGPVRQIVLTDSLLFALIGRKGLGIYSDFYTPGGTERYFRQFSAPLRRLFLLDTVLFIAADDGLLIFDVSQPASPRRLARYDFFGHQMAVKDSFLFLGKNILNISTPTRPVRIDTLPANYEPYFLQVRGNYLYAIEKRDPPVWDNFVIFDISAPDQAQKLSSLPLPGDWFSRGRALTVNDSMAFVGYFSDTGSGLLVVQTSDALHPQFINRQSLKPPVDLLVSDSLLLVAAEDDGFFKIDISDPFHLKTVYHYARGSTSYHVFARGQRAYIGTLNNLHILNISDLNQLQWIEKLQGVPQDSPIEPGHHFRAAAAFVPEDEKTLYLLDYGHGLFKLPASDASTDEWSSLPTGFLFSYPGTRYAVDEQRGLLVAAHKNTGFVIFDLDRWQKWPGTLSGYGLDVALQDTLLAVAIENKGFDVLSCKDPASPRWLMHIDLKEISALTMTPSYLIVAAYNPQTATSTLNIYRLDDTFFRFGPPTRILDFTFEGQVTDLAVRGNVIFAADANFGLRQFKFFDLDTIYQELAYPTYGAPQFVTLFSRNEGLYAEDYLLLADGQDGLYVYQLIGLIGIDSGTSGLPQTWRLGQNYPNPFNSRTVIPYDLPRSDDVQLTIFNLAGQKIKEWRFKNHAPGHHQVIFEASRLSSGLYLYRLKSAFGPTRYRKMVLLK